MAHPRLQTWIAGATMFAVGSTFWATLVPPSLAGGDVIEQVNRRVNQRLIYRETNNSYDWIPYTDAGDCKTYVALKRQALIRAGVKPERLTIWEGQDEKGGLHAILVVDGWRALDNRFSWTVRLRDLLSLGGPGRGYHMQRCLWCEQMVSWLSPLPQDSSAPLPDYGYAAQLRALHEWAVGSPRSAPAAPGR